MADRNHCEFSIRITVLEMNDDDYGLREINTFDVHQSNINYRAEGNANIVLALPLQCQVLRLPKSKRKTTAEHGHRLSNVFYVYKYIKSVSKLFGTHFTSPPSLVRLQFTNKGDFETWLNDLRPNERKLAASADLHFEYGLLYPDAAFLRMPYGTANSTFAVEIKPKQGWHIRQLPDDLLEMFDVNRDTIDKCRFCSMQFLKVNEGRVARVGDFCPLDLFSGDFPRLTKALRCLAGSPQNNFRIFKDGRLIYTKGSPSSELERIANEICLADNQQRERKTCDDLFTLLGRILLQAETVVGNASVLAEAAVTHDCVLNRVLNLQLLALETMPSIARKYSNESPLFDALARDDNWPFRHLNELCRKIDTYASSKIEIDKPFLESKLKLTHEELYEIGATSLDCSIMLTFQRLSTQIDAKRDGPIITIDGVNFIATSTVFDLDPKLYPKHFIKYIERTKQSYVAWTKSLSGK